ncbi:MAG TPA: AMP-binding protein [Streptosporangiaceae bacterium]|jgi:cyclohexanecarboxylate-CoA ligase|nr:AMP-binding protein [Streptosporangiaceae bacterium]
MAFATVHDRYSEADIARFYEAGLWRPETFPELADQQAELRPDKVFVTDGTATLTYRELRDSALRLAAGLRRLGIGSGDRVSVQVPSWAEFTQIALALNRIGAIMVPIMPIYRRDDVGYVLRNAGVRTAVTCGSFHAFDYLGMYQSLRDDCPDLQDLVVVRGGAGQPDGAVRLEDLFAGEDAAAGEQGPAAGPDDPFVIVFSSGTTARPKGCLHTFNTFGCGSRLLAQAFGYSERDVQFNPSPITHTTGLITGFLLPLMHGASVHLMEAWEPRAGLADIAKFHTTASVTATAFLQMLMDAYDPDQHDPSSMRLWVAAGSPIPEAFVRRARQVLPNMKVLSLYGRTENVTTTTCTVDDDPERSVTSDGKALPGSSVKIVDETGAEVPRGEPGDIAYRGPMHMLEYINHPEATAELFTPDGYSRSGDLGVMDADGYVRVTGRLKDIVIRGGLNISVRQVEDLLIAHPAIRAVAAVGMPDERLGERVCCYVVVSPGHENLGLTGVRDYLLKQGLAIQKAPERLEIVPELPMTATGKIQKHLLRADIATKIADGG